MIYQGPNPATPGTDRWNALPKTEQAAIYADYAAINRTPGFTPGLPAGFPEKAKTVQPRNGKPEVKDGTYLSESVAGFAVLDAEDMEAAVALAARIPAARLGGAVDVRPSERCWRR